MPEPKQCVAKTVKLFLKILENRTAIRLDIRGPGAKPGHNPLDHKVVLTQLVL